MMSGLNMNLGRNHRRTVGHLCPACIAGPTRLSCDGAVSRPTRRGILSAFGALAASAMTGSAIADAATAPDPVKADPAYDIVDVHHHIVPPAFVDYMPDLPDWVRAWRPERSLEDMDRNGVAAGIASLNSPGLTTAKPEVARAVSRGCNEYAAKLVQDYPGRFGMLAAVAPLDTEGALKEIAYSLDVLHAEGVGLMTSYGPLYLASAKFTPLFEELNRRKATVFVHPQIPEVGANFDPPLSPVFLEMPYDTARAILGMIIAGSFTRYPDITFIFNHGGGGLPVLHRRLDLTFKGDPKLRDRFPDGVMAQLRNVHFDTVNVLNPPNFALLRQLVAIDKLVFGTDYPGFSAVENVVPLRALPVADAVAIAQDNPYRLFPQLRARRASLQAKL